MKCADLKDVVILRAFTETENGLSLQEIQALFPDQQFPLNMIKAKLRILERRKFLEGGITELGLIELARLEGRVLEHRPHLSKGEAPAWLDKMIDASIEEQKKC